MEPCLTEGGGATILRSFADEPVVSYPVTHRREAVQIFASGWTVQSPGGKIQVPSQEGMLFEKRVACQCENVGSTPNLVLVVKLLSMKTNFRRMHVGDLRGLGIVVWKCQI